MAYVSLREKTRFIKDVEKAAGRDIREDEVTRAETFADAYIEGRLGKQWETGSVPEMIVEIADRIASAQIWKYIHSGQAPKANEYAKELMDEAKEIIDAIVNGEMGLKFSDGTWDEDYPGGNKEDSAPDNIEIIL